MLRPNLRLTNSCAMSMGIVRTERVSSMAATKMHRLKETGFGDAFGEIAETRGPAAAEDEKHDGDGVEKPTSWPQKEI